ncbi:MAG: cell division protein FtsZ [Ignavibacteriales bacterium]|nr:cell division protein FtsZ [Ignavibacteriales bacterium]MCF8438163.1 cell division protein FtsZ [Ignavibacteriales bacterium]
MPRIALDLEEVNQKDSKFYDKNAVIKVVGVGGGGCNAIESMIKKGLEGVEFVAMNTDAQALKYSTANHKIQIGNTTTKGLGTGADPKIGREATEEDRLAVEKVLRGSDMVFITAGMGGGTGTGGAPIVASVAKTLGALVVAIVTKPFRWEGKKRYLRAEQGINELKQYVDSLIVIPNDRILNIIENNIPATQAFDAPNDVLYQATRGIADIITVRGIINVDFSDVKSVMRNSGEALMGCGLASGENRAIEAAEKAITSPLLEGVKIKGAKNILLNVSGPDNLTIQEINAGNNVIFDAAGDDVDVIFGWVNRSDMKDTVSYTVIATGFDAPDGGGREKVKNPFQEINQNTDRKPSLVNKNSISYGFGRNQAPGEPEDFDISAGYTNPAPKKVANGEMNHDYYAEKKKYDTTQDRDVFSSLLD